MELPAITLPKIELPFDIPVLLHPAVDHFLIALPVVILLLELMNLMMKKKTISGISFFLIVLTVVGTVAAYFTGLTDGKEAYPALNEAAKTALGEHKLLGTYLMFASVVVLFFKLLLMITGKGLIRGLYILILIAFVAGIFEQGEEGGELVYVHGLNVEQVKVLDDELFDLKEEIEDLNSELQNIEALTPPTVTEVPAEETAPEATLETRSAEENTSAKTIDGSHPDSAKTEMKEKVEALQVEGMPEEMVQPEIATH